MKGSDGTMIIGIPKEKKKAEYRVACTPSLVEELVEHRHQVLVEKNAGQGSGFSNEQYQQAGAKIVDTTKDLYEKSQMIYKVKEILPAEFSFLRPDLIVFTYLHSNAYPEETAALLQSQTTAIAYEDIKDEAGRFPLLKPMSEIAGKGGFLAALHFSQKINGGQGLLLNRVTGVRTPDITIIGAGNVGMGAAEMATQFGNKVTILNRGTKRLEAARQKLAANVELLHSTPANIEMCLKRTDVLMNCVLWPKTRTDHLVTKNMLKSMKKGAMIIDIACDEAGAIESCHATTHDDPIYYVNGVLHYCVDNIPSAFSKTATGMLCNATFPYALEIADKGAKKALIDNKALRSGLTTWQGKLTLEETALKQKREYTTAEKALKS